MLYEAARLEQQRNKLRKQIRKYERELVPLGSPPRH